MGQSKLKLGQKWGAIEIVEAETRLWTAHEGSGVVVETARDWLTLKCRCGQEMEFWADEVPLRSDLRDCGCGVWARDLRLGRGPDRPPGRPRVLADGGVAVTLWLSRGLVERVDKRVQVLRAERAEQEAASSLDVSRSQVAGELLEAGLGVVEAGKGKGKGKSGKPKSPPKRKPRRTDAG